MENFLKLPFHSEDLTIIATKYCEGNKNGDYNNFQGNTFSPKQNNLISKQKIVEESDAVYISKDFKLPFISKELTITPISNNGEKYKKTGTDSENSIFTIDDDDDNINTSVNIQENSSRNCSGNAQRSNQNEPHVFDNNFGNFAQNYTDLTICQNESSIFNKNQREADLSLNFNFDLSGSIAPDTIENYPFFSSENPVDFPFITNNFSGNRIQLNEVSQINILDSKIDNDAPEYIDINSLMLSDFNEIPDNNGDKRKNSSQVPEDSKGNKKSKSDTLDIVNVDSEDDDVIFVKEYKLESKPKIVKESSPAPVKKSRKILPEPRRNPKRQVQIQKASTDLFLNDYHEDEKPYIKEHYTPCTRRSTRTTGAVYSPPTPLTANDFKIWPAEGMHEKPTYNPASEEIESTSSSPKRFKYSPCADEFNEENLEEGEISTKEHMASLTHDTLHHVLRYVEQLKDYDQLLDNSNYKNLPNVEIAEDILKDSCILYALANDVSDISLCKYLNDLECKENLEEYLDETIFDCTLT